MIFSATGSGRIVPARNGEARDAWPARRIAALAADERETLWRAVQIVGRIAGA